MKKTPIAILCGALSALGTLTAQEAKSAAKPAEPEVKKAEPAAPDAANVPMDKVSYFIGRNFGQQFGSQGIAIDIAALTEGIKSGMEGSKPKFSEQELMTAMQAFENMMQAKAQEEQKARMANAGKVKEDGLKFLAENGKKKGVTTTKSGLQYEVLKEGDGPKPVATDRVNVHYHGTLISGKVFDSSVERGQPITFGVQEVIKGWTEALQLMPVGSKWRIYLPSDIAYGDQGAGEDIGPGETLIFDVELLGIVK
ncbi:MAG: FKBP-type peptidyl-prolyl cis-trans isomerase [Verrucomicrobiaceae bacterium]|jgi:FKBP-type peptidyl-prolyl cis-trans isomerase|nr:FKBP-type peptidyl-prolyl cis-trans isomerase [Verrucomicrobiaceae bacterium]